jgi:hypothetical protein
MRMITEEERDEFLERDAKIKAYPFTEIQCLYDNGFISPEKYAEYAKKYLDKVNIVI